MINRSPAPARVGSRRRRARRIAAAAAAPVLPSLVLLASSPAYAAAHPDDGSEPGPGLTGLQTLLIFVGIPLAAIIVISILAAAPWTSRGPRYRPGLGWWAAPVWFNGPEEPDPAIRNVEAMPEAELARLSGGGASARW